MPKAHVSLNLAGVGRSVEFYRRRRFIVDVSAMEGQFSRDKTVGWTSFGSRAS